MKIVKTTAMLLLLLGRSAFGLVDGEQFKVKVRGVHPGNIIVLPRGLEDAVTLGNHVRLTLPNGFIARGIAVRVEMQKSFWKVYRIVRPEYLNRRYTYDLRVINQSAPPHYYEDLVAGRKRVKIDPEQITLFNQAIKDEDERDDKQLLAENDFPKDLTQDEQYLDSKKNIFQKMLDKEKWKKDLRHIDFSIYAAPLRRETQSNLSSHFYGIDVKNRPSKRYELLLGHQSYGFSQENPILNQSSSISRIRTHGKVNYHNMNKRLIYTTEVERFEQKVATVAILKQQIRVAPLGFMYQFYTSGIFKSFQLGLVPMLESRSSETFLDGQMGTDSGFTVRNSLRAYLQIKKGAFEFENDFRYQPAMNAMGDDDNDLTNQFFIRYCPTQTLNLEYSNTYVQDGRQRELAGITPTNVIHSFNIRVNFSL